MKHLLAIALVGAVGLLGVKADASTVNFTGTTTGDINTASGFNSGSGNFIERIPGTGLSGVRWGNNNDAAPSTLEVLDTSFDEAISFGTNLVKVAEIEWTNEEWSNFDPSFSLNIDLDFNVTSPAPGFTEDEQFTVTITTTNNANVQDADQSLFLNFNNGIGQPRLLTEGVTLTNLVLGLTSGTGSLVGGNAWILGESQTSTLAFYAEIESTVSAVPLPAAGWMLLVGVGGMAAFKRRRKAA